MRRLLTLVALVVAGSLAATAGAGTTRITKGQAQAAFDAFATGGWAIQHHNPAAYGAPGNFGAAIIRPFDAWDGAHYCADDWHAFVIGDFDLGTRQQVVSELTPSTASFTIDGAPVAVSQTPFKRFLRFGDEAWVTQWGTVLLLPPGAHTFDVELTDPFGPATFAVTVFMDAPGTGACLS